MSLNYPKAGFNLATEFQSSGIPFVTSSVVLSNTTLRIDLHHISKFVCVRNHSGSGSMCRIGFTKNGVEGANYFRLEGGQSQTWDLRVKEIYIRPNGAFAVSVDFLGGLTNVMAREMGPLTGTLSDGTEGWGGVG